MVRILANGDIVQDDDPRVRNTISRSNYVSTLESALDEELSLTSCELLTLEFINLISL